MDDSRSNDQHFPKLYQGSFCQGNKVVIGFRTTRQVPQGDQVQKQVHGQSQGCNAIEDKCPGSHLAIAGIKPLYEAFG